MPRVAWGLFNMLVPGDQRPNAELLAMTEAGNDVQAEIPLAGILTRSAFIQLGRLTSRYLRLQLDVGPGLPEAPALVVLNHGFGTFADLNVLIGADIIDRLGYGPAAPTVLLTHSLAWTLKVGPLLEPAGFRPANYDTALRALRAGMTVFVMPGGDLDGSKPWGKRNQVSFNGRSGFARLAQQAGVPIAPIVVTGAGDTLLTLTDGSRIAERVGLARAFRLKTLPISFALPWGLNVCTALVGYLPWPAKMRARVLAPVTVDHHDDPAEAAQEIENVMNAAASEMTAGRNPYLDWLRG